MIKYTKFIKLNKLSENIQTIFLINEYFLIMIQRSEYCPKNTSFV